MYEEMFRLPWRAQLESFSVFRALGDLSGAQVLDIGCGTGSYSREMKRCGDARVVGYDISEGVLAVARQAEAEEPLGIEYVTSPPDAGTVGIALAVYVLPYAEDSLERALREAGFDGICWPAFGVSEEGTARYGEEFRRPYPECPDAAIITCRRT
ncbi:class I SAM-dependent methyltransferase [Streptomyces celluloflavus]|uniref:class I SAM-dependent methyltransferase n=1 Tax=Streptomyces celluloflavus TaxID=58344 RepID=UPI0036788626